MDEVAILEALSRLSSLDKPLLRMDRASTHLLSLRGFEEGKGQRSRRRYGKIACRGDLLHP